MLQQLPLYQCHKIVRAARILEAMHGEEGAAGKLWLEIPGGILEHAVPADWMAKHEPEIGGFYVEYQTAQGEYASYSPAAPFEEGYHLLPDPPAPSAELLQLREFAGGAQWGGSALGQLASMREPLRFNQVNTIAGERFPTDWKGQRDE